MKRVAALLGAVTLAMSGAGLLFGPAIPAAHAIPTMTRSEIVARAESALGLTYSWGKESWVPDTGSGSGTDCSGLTLKCWQVPRTMLYQEEDGTSTPISPRYTTFEFYHCVGPWYRLASRSLLQEGDILVTSDGNSGHVVIYAGGDAWNSPIIYEAPGTGLRLRRAARDLGSTYLPRRRNSLLETTTIILDNPTAKSVGGTDIGGNWSRSTSSSGYYGDNYQTQAATTANAYARWTPRFPTSGSYDVYMRWTSGTNRASSAKVVIAAGPTQYIKYVNQRVSGGTWYSLGRYNFRAGYSPTLGSVTLYAMGANGFVIADAVKFVPVQ